MPAFEFPRAHARRTDPRLRSMAEAKLRHADRNALSGQVRVWSDGLFRGGWKMRYCVLEDSHLYMYETSRELEHVDYLDVRKLSSIVEAPHPRSDAPFVLQLVMSDQKVYHMATNDTNDAARWKRGLLQQKERLNTSGRSAILLERISTSPSPDDDQAAATSEAGDEKADSVLEQLRQAEKSSRKKDRQLAALVRQLEEHDRRRDYFARAAEQRQQTMRAEHETEVAVLRGRIRELEAMVTEANRRRIAVSQSLSMHGLLPPPLPDWGVATEDVGRQSAPTRK